MYFVYAISSTIRNYIYVGLTNNVERRFAEHQAGKNISTHPYRPFEIVYMEEVETRLLAR